MVTTNERRVREAYDLVVRQYEASVAEELRQHLDCGALDAFAARCAARGVATGATEAPAVLDVGCGLGHTIAHPQGRDLTASAVDLSPAVVELTQRRNSDVEVIVVSLLRLPHPDESFAEALSLYSIIYLPPNDVPATMTDAVTNVGLVVDARVDRRPVPDIELATARTTLVAHLEPPDSGDDQ